jgi:3',5'-cyclic AMP phosphodiesterase CpdA
LPASSSRSPPTRGVKPVNHHAVTFTGLEPNTLYAYRVQGGGGAWSEWFQVRTAPLAGPISFVYLGDAQNGILSHWSRLIRAAYAAAPDARFIIHAGDLVNSGSRDYEWAQWFKASGFIHGMIPAVPVPGNHEYSSAGPEGATQSFLSLMWRPQFNLPKEPDLPERLRETAYAVRYSADLDVFVLDTQGGELQAQADWLDRELAASKKRWRVVTFHHPVFSSGSERDDPRRRAILLPVLRKHNVDLVLQGHDHTYARGQLGPEPGQTPGRIATRGPAAGEVTTMFVNSVSGPKQYEWRPKGWDDYAEHGVALGRRAENTQFFQIIKIDGARLSYGAYTADGQLYDAVTLQKAANGKKRVIKGPVSTMSERMLANTKSPAGGERLDP